MIDASQSDSPFSSLNFFMARAVVVLLCDFRFGCEYMGSVIGSV